MIYDDGRWWLTLPPCPKCGLSHVLIDCRARLPFEVDDAASWLMTLTGEDGSE